MDIKKIENFNRKDYGAFLPFIDNMNVTDIEWNGCMLLVTDLEKGKYCVKNHGITEKILTQFMNAVSNAVNEQFNQANGILEAETADFRITMIHESLAVTGTVVAMRRITAVKRLDVDYILKTEYCPKEMLSFLINCMKVKTNIVICGKPGAGKSEFLKFLTGFTSPYDRAITVEDSLELHYREINPKKDCIAFKVSEQMSYSKAIREAMRLNARWLMITEVRGEEIEDVITAYTTGVKGLLTIHTDDVRKLPDRILHMSKDVKDEKRIIDTVYEWIDIVILVQRKPAEKDGGIYNEDNAPRYMDQICIYAREDGENHLYMLMDNGKVQSLNLPSFLKERMSKNGITNPFVCAEVC